MLKDFNSSNGFLKKKPQIIPSYAKALDWIKNNSIPEKGILISSRQKVPYPEVTGYLIPTLIDAGEYNLAERYAEFLSYIQHPNGAFAGPDGAEYIFDSGQALRGLLKASQKWSRFETCAKRTAEFIVSKIETFGLISAPPGYADRIPESVHVFILPALAQASLLLDKPEYLESAHKSLEYYKKSPTALDPNELTHFLAYTIDGFIDMGEVRHVKPVVDEIFSLQRADGSIPAHPNVKWVCSTGLAQLAIIAYKLGMDPEGDKAVSFLCRLQNKSGGFYGSYGPGAKYFPEAEISWANKFFLDALHAKVSSFFDANAKIFPLDVSAQDGRLEEVFDRLGDLQGKKVLDAGCGKGRFALKVKNRYPSCEMHGLDISKELLREVPEGIITKEGSLISLPYESENFDAVFCIESLEHAIRIEKAIEEICRVVRPGGKIIIIDKNIEKLGKIKITDFEQWFSKEKVKRHLETWCGDVEVREIGYGGKEPDGLFISWSSIKDASGMDDQKWHEAIIGSNDIKKISADLRRNQFPVWCKPMLQNSQNGESMLELGSGTGTLSAVLAMYGRDTYLLDYSKDSIEYAKNLFKELNLKGNFLCQDILNRISMDDDSVDWVWSSGLLEHFTDEQITEILNESLRVGKKGVMSLVPNANAIFYRIGKYKKELDGTWPYGREIPRFTMKPFFEAAGLKNVQEYSVDPYHTLNFWNTEREEIKKFFDDLSLDELKKLNQGYLLFTYGEKGPHSKIRK
jgi:malonyl-CoA O-methyltransferase